MTDCPVEDRNSKEYWEWRVRAHKNDMERMIWYGNKWKWDALDMMAKKVLGMFSECTVLDVACGHGRYSEL